MNDTDTAPATPRELADRLAARFHARAVALSTGITEEARAACIEAATAMRAVADSSGRVTEHAVWRARMGCWRHLMDTKRDNRNVDYVHTLRTCLTQIDDALMALTVRRQERHNEQR